MIRVGIVGCGRAARIHLDRYGDLKRVRVVGVADRDQQAASTLAAQAGTRQEGGKIPTFSDHQALLRSEKPDVLAVFTPHRFHYQPAVDAIQANCHVFIEKPLSTNVQEANDIANLARARALVVGVGHQYRLCPSLREARRLLAQQAIGPIRLITATLTQNWLAAHSTPDESWRLDAKISGGGMLCDAGDHLVDALLWVSGRSARQAFAVQDHSQDGLDLVTAAAIRLDGGVPATLALCGVSQNSLFELAFFGESGSLAATDRSLVLTKEGISQNVNLSGHAERSIDADFFEAVLGGEAPCCPAADAVETVKLLEAINRSASTGLIAQLG